MLRYADWIQDNLELVDKTNSVVPFRMNPIQERYMRRDHVEGQPEVILKARQQGFSSVLLARFLCDFLLTPNSRSVVVADIEENAETLLARLKFYLESFERKHKIKVPLKYNSKSELHCAGLNTTFSIGTAKNTEFGRSQTITNLHLSEVAFYGSPSSIIASAGQAVIPGGYFTLETTANGFNEFKTLWDDSVSSQSGFKPLFYKASDFYDAEFLALKRQQLGRKFVQEYPENPMEAFLTSGDPYFSADALAHYNLQASDPQLTFS